MQNIINLFYKIIYIYIYYNTMNYNEFKKNNLKKKFKFNKQQKLKLFSCLKKKLNIWKDIKKNKEIIKLKNKLKNKNLEYLLIKNLELFINNIGISYLYWIKWKQIKSKKSYMDLINTINQDFKKQFGKSTVLDTQILIFIYNNILDNIITKETLNYCLNKLNSKKKIKGGMLDKIFILHYLEENYEWVEWLLIFVDLVLDIVGLIPPFGWAVDIAGLIISILRKDWIGALMSLIGIIPLVGSLINTPYSIIRNAFIIINKLKKV